MPHCVLRQVHTETATQLPLSRHIAPKGAFSSLSTIVLSLLATGHYPPLYIILCVVNYCLYAMFSYSVF